jgi:D-glycerate 3-kinase
MHPSNLSLISILEKFLAGNSPATEELSLLKQIELTDKSRAETFGITEANVAEVVREKIDLFLSLIEDKNKLPFSLSDRLETFWHLWLPLVILMATKREKLGRPLIQGILGVQGTGKTTLAQILIFILAKIGWNAISISLDDLYKTYGDRQQLKQQDPRFIWRGPPGTHDVELGIQLLDKLRQFYPPNSPQQLIEIPRFDKSLFAGAGDRTTPEFVSNIDIVFFEGWCVGVLPIDPTVFDFAPPPIITETDRKFARDINNKLQDYLPLWQKLDSLIVLYPKDYRVSKKWRLQAEKESIARGKSGMSDEEVERFVEYFWKALHPELFVKPLLNNSELVEVAVELFGDRSIARTFRPINC